MSTAGDLNTFKALHAELFQQLMQQEWGVAASLAGECQQLIKEAFKRKKVEQVVASDLMDQLAAPHQHAQFSSIEGVSELWDTQEMKLFILKHLDLTPSHVLSLADAISANTVDPVIKRMVRRGVLEMPDAVDPDDEPQPRADSTMQLIHVLLDKGFNVAAGELVGALAKTKNLGDSNFFANENFVQAILRLGETDIDILATLRKIEGPLCKVTDLMRNRKIEPLFNRPPLQDLASLAALGAPALARRLFVTGDYISQPVELSAVASDLGGPFTRDELIDMGNYRIDFRGDTRIWFGNALSYWLDNPETPWPFFNKLDAGDSARDRLRKSILAYTSYRDRELDDHAHILAHTYECRPFGSEQERERLMRQAAKLYMEGYPSDEGAKRLEAVMRKHLPRMLQVAIFPDRDLEMAIDLGL
ncbi:hypothetical protein [Pseudomonas amygdali]|uniref:Uncharacterized protein n=2 Tax=Pseudomonas amygdali pv. lachrymans TaxID=53707 RepID=A0ABR5KS13_PSEAV|nr:hypothetical protein [Pseudomonas amygdali]AXH59944.1 hypothetical protein PLA107_032480 [Pseudomonas amygdali pv. lachrymans str. M301315]KPC17352.1 Uncharacterized protein AC499_0554 [Pseudomonas amygdali pv. lachrymans]RMT05756.1 hypothetical protein ALP54_03808 [Pseudomonas amygdali pv. lachrymans]